MRRRRRLSTGVLASGLGGLLLGTAGVVVPVTGPPVPGAPPPVEITTERLAGADPAIGATAHATGSADLVALRWRGDPEARLVVEARRGGRWRASPLLGAADDDGPDPGTAEAARAAARRRHGDVVSAPVWVGGADALRVRVRSGAPSDLRLVRIRVGRPRAMPAAAGAAVPAPGIISRAEWGADEGLRLRNCPEGPSEANNVQLAVVHHTAGTNAYGPGDSPAIVRGLYAYATNVLGYCDTHYNFLVDRYGRIFEGRFGGVGRPVIGAHATGINRGTVGVAVMGDFSTADPPAAVLDALERLLAWKLAWHGAEPRRPVTYTTLGGTDRWPPGTTRQLPVIIGHRDPGNTSCPGQRLYDRLPALRAAVTRRIVNAPVDILTAWAAAAGRPKLLVAAGDGALYPAGGQPRVWPPAGWPGADGMVRDVATRADGSGYVLDAYGRVLAFGGAPPAAGAPSFPVPVARDLVLGPDGRSGYVLDGYGGIHPFGGAPRLPAGPYWWGWDIARSLLPVPGGAYLLDGYGGVHRIGSPPDPGPSPYWPGWDIARRLVARPGAPGAYVLDGYGGLHPIAGAPRLPDVPYYGRDRARDLVLVSDGSGYALDDAGMIRRFGDAPAVTRGRVTFGRAPSIMSPHRAVALAYQP